MFCDQKKKNQLNRQLACMHIQESRSAALTLLAKMIIIAMNIQYRYIKFPHGEPNQLGAFFFKTGPIIIVKMVNKKTVFRF